MDHLANMFQRQADLQDKLGVKFDQEYISTMTLAAIDELMEALRETPWKPWKKKQKLNVDEFKEELIDVWHFLINLSIASGMDSYEVVARFTLKNNINKKRKDEGY